MKDNKTRPVDSYAHADFMESVFSNLRAFCDAECQRLTAGYPQLSNQNSKALTASCRRHKHYLPVRSNFCFLKPGPKARLNQKTERTSLPLYLLNPLRLTRDPHRFSHSCPATLPSLAQTTGKVTFLSESPSEPVILLKRKNGPLL